ncbi:MAG: hypothetical protein ACJZ45_02060, partial [Nitrospinia bacterium]
QQSFYCLSSRLTNSQVTLPVKGWPQSAAMRFSRCQKKLEILSSKPKQYITKKNDYLKKAFYVSFVLA